MKRYLFVVQGEGRGHMTQAMSLKRILEDAGHKVEHVLVGKSERRTIPAFFTDHFGENNVTSFTSPNFATDSFGKSIDLKKTVIENLRHLPDFLKFRSLFPEVLELVKPDMVINFYEPLTGLYYGTYHPSTPMICIAHQYMFLHQGYSYPVLSKKDQLSLLAFTKLTALGASKKLALSLYPLAEDEQSGVHVAPPLLRKELFEQEVKAGNNYLIYVNNHGYADDIMAWHAKNPEVECICFWDKKGVDNPWTPQPNLRFYQVHDKMFLEAMAHCKGLITTAGFESLCEALYLGKPTYMMPVEGHFEQYCNAFDGQRSGVGIFGLQFDLDFFMRYADSHTIDAEWYKSWLNTAATSYLEYLS